MLVKVQLYYLNLKQKNKKNTKQTNKKTIVSDLKHYNHEDYTEDYTNQ